MTCDLDRRRRQQKTNRAPRTTRHTPPTVAAMAIVSTVLLLRPSEPDLPEELLDFAVMAGRPEEVVDVWITVLSFLLHGRLRASTQVYEKRTHVYVR